MKNLMIKILIAAAAIVTLLFLTNRLWCSGSGIPPELIEIKKIEIQNFNADSINLYVTVKILNKNNFQIDVSNFAANILHNNNSIGTAKQNDMIHLNALDTAEVSFYAAFFTKSFVNSVGTESDSINLKMLGTAEADLGLFSVPVDIDLEYKLDVKNNISRVVEKDVQLENLIKLEGGKIKSLGTSESVVEVEFKVKNPYGIDFTVEGYPSKIFINEKEAGSGDIKSKIEIKRKSENISAVSVYKLDNFKTITSLFGSIFSKKLTYKTTGILFLDILGYKLQFPYNFNGVLIKI